MSILGDRLRELRGEEAQGLFAARLGLKQAVYCHYEKGRREPSLDQLVNIAATLHITTDELLGLERPQSTYSVTGSGNVVAQGAGAKVQIGAAGELPQCSKCPHRKKLEKLERLLAK